MKKLLLIGSLFLSSYVTAGQWVTLTPENIADIETIQAGAMSFAAEGVYFKHVSTFATAENCARKDYIAILDPKLADRAYAAGLYAMATKKTLLLWVDGCTNSYLLAKGIMITQ